MTIGLMICSSACMKSEVKPHFVPSQVCMRAHDEPMWSAHEVETGRMHAGEAERVELLLVEGEVLEAPAHLLAGHDLALAVALLRAPHRLDAEHLDDQAARVEHWPTSSFGPGALALVVDVLEDVLDHLRLLARTVFSASAL